MPSVAAADLQAFAGRVFHAAGCALEESERIARYLVGANLAGHDSHGVVRIPRYVNLLAEGLVLPGREVRAVVDLPSLAVLDGEFGFGQTVAPQAVAVGVEKCRTQGLAAVALRNSGHIGRVADWALQAADAGLVSVHFVNAAGSVLVAPFDSAQRRFSTAPFCVGVPLPDRPPLVLDFATSQVAEGKALVASQGGKPLPADALVGPDGEASADPRLLYGDYEPGGPRDLRQGAGALRSFGGHKGSGLALMCELLGGGLSGNGCTASGRRFSNGMFSLYIDPTRLDPAEVFPAEAVRYLEFVKAGRPIPGGEVLLPGEPEARCREARLAGGVPVSDETWEALLGTARGVGLALEGTLRPAPPCR